MQLTLYHFHCVMSVVLTWQMGAMVPGQVSMLVMSAAGCQQAVDTLWYVVGQLLAAGADPSVSPLPQCIKGPLHPAAELPTVETTVLQQRKKN
jgi:hypothetical protein